MWFIVANFMLSDLVGGLLFEKSEALDIDRGAHNHNRTSTEYDVRSFDDDVDWETY